MGQVDFSRKASNRNQSITLSKSTKIFLFIVCLNGIANSLSSIFINVYLYKLSQDFFEVALFNFVSYLVWAPAFVLTGWLSKKTDRKYGLIIGGGFQLYFYVLLLLFGSTASNHILFLGIIFGIGSGFYWLSVNTLSVDLTDHSNRDWFNGVNGIFGAISQMIGPIAASWIITIQPGFSGYKMIFTLTFIFILISVALTFLLPKNLDKGKFNWKSLWQIHKNVEWRQLSIIFSSLAFRDGVLSFAVWIWVYMVTGSEGSLGNYVFYTTSLSIITYYLIGRFIHQQNRWRYILIGTIGVSVAVFGLVIDVNFMTLIFYGFAAGICIPLFEVPFNTLSLNTISKFDNQGKNRIEMVVSRELALSIGRIPSVGGLMLIYLIEQNQSIWIAAYLLLVILIGLLSLVFLQHYKKTIITVNK